MISPEEFALYMIDQTLEGLTPLFQHSDFTYGFTGFDEEDGTISILMKVRSAPKWADAAYEYGHHENMKYDKPRKFFQGIDGQPRVFVTNDKFYNAIRYKAPFLYKSNVSLNIWAEQPTHYDAERQLGKYYALWKVADGLEPIDVFRKFIEYYD